MVRQRYRQTDERLTIALPCFALRASRGNKYGMPRVLEYRRDQRRLESGVADL